MGPVTVLTLVTAILSSADAHAPTVRVSPASSQRTTRSRRSLCFEPASAQVDRQLMLELAMPKRMFSAIGEVTLESKKQLADRSVASPDFADALVLSLALTDQGSSNKAFAAPTVASSPRGFPELSGGPGTGSSTRFDDRSPAVAGGL